MHDPITLTINGRAVQVTRGTLVSAVLLTAGVPSRISNTGQPRTALCGMGICLECRAMVDGILHRRTCQLPCRAGMMVETQ